MRTSLARRSRVVSLLTVVLSFTLASPTWAHQEVSVGPLRLEIGFGTEPAFTGQLNSVQIIVTRGGTPVTHDVNVEAEVSFGDAAISLNVEPTEEPGDYRAWFIPSQPGDYSFRIRGRIDGTRVNETVTSGPSTFAEVKDPATATFPTVEAPSNEELAQRIETESARTAESTQTALRAVSAADDAASSAKRIGVIGVVLGAIGTIAALAAARRR